jgi:hypothetical protein
MKRSRIFLGASTCLLAIAGFAASKFHSTSPAKTGFISSVTSGVCTVNEGLNYTTVGRTVGRGGKAIVTVSSHRYTVKTQLNPQGACGQTLYTVHND